MKTVLFATAAVAALGLAACQTPLWPASHGDVSTHVKVEAARSQEADAQLHTEAQAALARANQAQASATAAAESAKHPFGYTVLMTDDSVTFASGKAELTEAQASLQAIVDKLKSDNRNVYIEIQGHGDEHGSPAYNTQLGQKRAEAVRRYMADQGVPLPRMTTISYGESRPKAEGTAPKADAQNRRAVVIVLSGEPA